MPDLPGLEAQLRARADVKLEGALDALFQPLTDYIGTYRTIYDVEGLDDGLTDVLAQVADLRSALTAVARPIKERDEIAAFLASDPALLLTQTG